MLTTTEVYHMKHFRENRELSLRAIHLTKADQMKDKIKL